MTNEHKLHLLFIEPSRVEKLETPIEDELTSLVQMAYDRKTAEGFLTPQGVFNDKIRSKGWHSTDCGQHSTSVNYLLENGMVTNSLCVFYVKYYRNSIQSDDIEKLKQLAEFYSVEIDWDNAFEIQKTAGLADSSSEMYMPDDLFNFMND